MKGPARIAVLETVHPDGVAALRRFATVDDHIGLERAAVLRIVGGYHGIVVKSVTRVDPQLLDHAPLLKVVGRPGTGMDNIDIPAAEARGVQVRSTPGGNAVAAAEFTLGLMLGLCRRFPEIVRRVDARDYRRALLEGRQLSALTVGLIGLGRVGIEVARRLRPFGCGLVGYDPSPDSRARFTALGGRTVADNGAVAAACDILSLHLSLMPETRRAIDHGVLARLRPGAMLVNTSRGAVIDDEALLVALDDGRLSAAALDLLDPEPPYDRMPDDHDFFHPLLAHPKVWVTPHLGASTFDCQRAMMLQVAADMQTVLEDRP